MAEIYTANVCRVHSSLNSNNLGRTASDYVKCEHSDCVHLSQSRAFRHTLPFYRVYFLPRLIYRVHNLLTAYPQTAFLQRSRIFMCCNTSEKYGTFDRKHRVIRAYLETIQITLIATPVISI